MSHSSLVNLCLGLMACARFVPLWFAVLFVAIPAFGQQTASLTPEQQRRLAEAAALNEKSKVREAAGDGRSALALARQALELRLETLGTGDPSNALAANQLAGRFDAHGDYAAARSSYELALTLYRNAYGERHAETALAHNNLGYALGNVGDYAAAKTHLEQSLAIYRELYGDDYEGLALVYNNLGWMFKQEGKYVAARPHYERALILYWRNSGKEHPDTLAAANVLAGVYAELGEYEKAQLLYEHVLKVRKEILGERHPDTALAMNNLGWLLGERGDFAASRRWHELALEIREEVLGADHSAVAESAGNLAGALAAMGDYAAARPYYERQLTIYRDVFGDAGLNTALASNNLGSLLTTLADYEAARPHFERALAIYQDAFGENHVDVAWTLNMLGWWHDQQHEHAEARTYYLQSLAIRKQVLREGHPAIALSLSNVAGTMAELGDRETALRLYEQALQLRRKELGERHPDTVNTLNNLGWLHGEMRNYEAAQHCYEQALAIRREALGESHPDTALSMHNLAWLFAETERYDESAAMFDSSRRARRLHTARILPSLSEREQLDFLKYRDEFTFHSALSLGLLRRDDVRMTALSGAWLLNGKAVVREALTQKAIAARRGNPGVDESSDPWIELSDVRHQLPQDAVLIDIVRMDVANFQGPPTWLPAKYVAWIAPAEGAGEVAVVDLGDAERIDQAVQDVREALISAPETIRRRGEFEAEREFGERIRALADLVLQPLHPRIAHARRWIVSPDAQLWLVPWQALPLADGRYAVEQYEIRYLVSGRDLIPTHEAVASSGRPAVFADPRFEGDASAAASAGTSGGIAALGFPPASRLPGTAAEAQAIAPRLAQYAGQPPQLLLGADATERAFAALRGPRVLALCTHGFYFADDGEVDPTDGPSDSPQHGLAGRKPENPLLRCGLLLAGCNSAARAPEDDGVLTGWEIVNADLRGTELAVLSACQTGVGAVRNGEGVAGLRHAFELAGAASVVASLWQAPDVETARLMNDFFNCLAKGETRSEALRAAQLARIASRRHRDGAAHPFYWAAFTLTGANR